MYTTNPKMPKIRRDAVLFANKHGVRCAARHFGFSPGAIVEWRKKAKVIGLHPIPTKSSRPKHSHRTLDNGLVEKIVDVRLRTKRSSEVVHRVLAENGIHVSLSTVKRTLDRGGYTKKRSPWKRYHPPSPRPLVNAPGALIQADTVHLAVQGKTVLYVFTCIDVYSRWAYARCYTRANCRTATDFIKQAQVAAPFLFQCVQTDNGSEFSTHFTERIQIRHRHTRVRKSNDNAHVERFNRTLREECLDALPVDHRVINQHLPKYLAHYVNDRHHFGINLVKPVQLLERCSQAID
ncbi:transposase family protein [Candidatus Kaiserbacteria bacterium]|nr:transposase family protein [Candidatus Kaiserbacteria bacterium]USN92391.1 MAG: transposase family protein [Candidatus Nomurabacteria bacterium]USN92624.1 MAG: transposase family protein [Candidatus Nomurabacteria bacterium]